MRPTQLRWQLVFLTLGNLISFCALAGLAAWLIGGSDALPDDAGVLAVTLAVLAVAIPLWFTAAAARRILAALEHERARAARIAHGREQALRAADRTKDEFLAMLGHELRNPLSAQAAAAHVLSKSGGDGPARQAADVIARQVEHMTRLIEDLLDVTRVTRGKVSLSRQPLEIGRTVERAVAALRGSGRLARHSLSAELDHVWARADEARLEQIVSNLIGNAIKYTPSGGTITVNLRRDRDTAVLRVRDNGIGMSPDLAARVFDLFVQGDESERGAGGLGIGLALVRLLAELHGGKVYAASAGPGEGSVFTVCLPAIEAPAPPRAADGPTLTTPAHSRHRIVLVEDNADTRNSLFEALALDGHRVYEAADARAGMRTIAAMKPDVAIIDIGLPDINGYDLAAKLRGESLARNMVLIGITGRDQPDSLRRAREAGFDEYVTKPIAPDRLVRLIDAAITRTGKKGK